MPCSYTLEYFQLSYACFWEGPDKQAVQSSAFTCRQGAPTSSDILSSGLRSDSEYLGGYHSMR